MQRLEVSGAVVRCQRVKVTHSLYTLRFSWSCSLNNAIRLLQLQASPPIVHNTRTRDTKQNRRTKMKGIGMITRKINGSEHQGVRNWINTARRR